MVSRKKLKGQARKAKAKEKARGPLFALLKQLRSSSKSSTSSITLCLHGWEEPNEPAEDCNKFIEVVLDVITKATIAGTACADAIDNTQDLEVWNHKNQLEW